MNNLSKILLGTTVALSLAVASGSAFAADLPVKAAPVAAPVAAPAGAYVSVFGGWAAPMTAEGTYTTNNAAFSMPFNSGYVIGAALGTHIIPNLRGEVEVSYVAHDVSGTISATPPGLGQYNFPSAGTGSTLYLLGNLWYDIDTGSSITPYLGGGLGAAVLMPNLSFVGAPGGTFDTDSWAVAGQLGAGIKFQIADNITLDLGYRAKGVYNATLTSKDADGGLAGLHYVDQTVQAGLTFGF